jgi:hypothetical protein
MRLLTQKKVILSTIAAVIAFTLLATVGIVTRGIVLGTKPDSSLLTSSSGEFMCCIYYCIHGVLKALY